MGIQTSASELRRYETEIEDLWRLSRAVVLGLRGLATAAETFQPCADDFTALSEIAEHVDGITIRLRDAIRDGE